jgi:hypothetical protein
MEEADFAEIDDATLARIYERLAQDQGAKGKRTSQPDDEPSARKKLFTEDGQPDGGRDHALYQEVVASWGDKVRARGVKVLDDDEVYAEVLTHLEGLNATRVHPPFDAGMVRAKCDSALRFHRDQAAEFENFDPASHDGQRCTSIRHEEGRTDAAFARRFHRSERQPLADPLPEWHARSADW